MFHYFARDASQGNGPVVRRNTVVCRYGDSNDVTILPIRRVEWLFEGGLEEMTHYNANLCDVPS